MKIVTYGIVAAICCASVINISKLEASFLEKTGTNFRQTSDTLSAQAIKLLETNAPINQIEPLLDEILKTKEPRRKALIAEKAAKHARLDVLALYVEKGQNLPQKTLLNLWSSEKEQSPQSMKLYLRMHFLKKLLGREPLSLKIGRLKTALIILNRLINEGKLVKEVIPMIIHKNSTLQKDIMAILYTNFCGFRLCSPETLSTYASFINNNLAESMKKSFLETMHKKIGKAIFPIFSLMLQNPDGNSENSSDEEVDSNQLSELRTDERIKLLLAASSKSSFNKIYLDDRAEVQLADIQLEHALKELQELFISGDSSEDEEGEISFWFLSLNILLTSVAQDSNIEDIDDWKELYLVRASEDKTPYFFLNDAALMAQMQPKHKAGLVTMITVAEAALRLELAKVIIMNHEEKESIAATRNDEFARAVMDDPAVLLKEPFNEVLTAEERQHVTLAIAIKAKKDQRIARFISENKLIGAFSVLL